MIVGVVGDVRQTGLDRETVPDIYYPIAQNVAQIGDLGLSLIASTHVPPATLTSPIRETIRATHPNVAIFGVATMDDVVRDSLAGTAFYSWLVGSFAVLALLVACAGIYGVMASIVAARTREFGIRLALGCDRRRVERLVLKHAAVLAALGLAVGTAGAIASARFLESLVVGASRIEATTMVGAMAILTLVSLSPRPYLRAVPRGWIRCGRSDRTRNGSRLTAHGSRLKPQASSLKTKAPPRGSGRPGVY